jgi:uncharacterized protein
MGGYAKPIPAVTPELQPFFDAAKRHELVVQRCRSCGATRFPARPTCAHCLSGEAEWVRVGGRGTVFTYNVMHQVYHPAFAPEVPYTVVLIQLDEGPKMISNLIGVAPEDIRIGMRVEVVFEDLNDQVTLPKFKLLR